MAFTISNIARNAMIALTAAMSLTACVAGAADGLDDSADTEANVLALTSPDASRDFLGCMIDSASEAYKDVDKAAQTMCNVMPYDRAHSMREMKVWTMHDRTTPFVSIGFAGTRLTSPTDVTQDVKSTQLYTHKNPLDPQIGGPQFAIGAGWEYRWRDLATRKGADGRSLRDVVDDWAHTAMEAGEPLVIFLSGHSLGAVTAMIAGYDLDDYLTKHFKLKKRIYVHAFNAPHLGNAAAQSAYQAKLLQPCTDYSTGSCLTLHMLDRGWDPVEGVPLGLVHPLWNTSTGTDAKQLGIGPNRSKSLPYCPQYHAPAVSYAFLWKNHSLERWRDDLNGIPEEHIQCMYYKQ